MSALTSCSELNRPAAVRRLEIELERYQRRPLYESLNLPKIRISSRLPMDVLESMVGLQQELERKLNEQVATPEEARRANGELRAMMRERDNYFPEYEAEAQKVLRGRSHQPARCPTTSSRTSPGTSDSPFTTWATCRIPRVP